MQQELLRLQAELNKTIIFVTHDPNEAVTLGDRIVILRKGEIVQQGTPQEIVSAPADDYVANFMKGVALLRVLTAGQLIDDDHKPVALSSVRSWLASGRASQPYVAVVGPDGRLAGIAKRNHPSEEESTSVERLSQDFISLSAEEPIAPYVPDLVNGRKCIVVVESGGTYRGMLSRDALLRAIGTDPAITSSGARAKPS